MLTKDIRVSLFCKNNGFSTTP